MSKPVELTFTVTVTIDPEKWAAEYFVPEAKAVEDAKTYLFTLFHAGLSSQMDWGVIKSVDTILKGK